MHNQRWFDALHDCQLTGQPYVLVTVLASAGSAPREAGAKMVVMGDTTIDTIGGGHLEFEAVAKARELLLGGVQTQHLEHYPLSSRLGQCCGGAVNLLFEVMIAHGQVLALYGAGHVAKALVPILAQLPLQIRWIDERPDLFPAAVASNVHIDAGDDPVATIRELPAGAWIVIMTHNHQLDFELVQAALKRDDLPYVGMIGSDTKSRRFRTRLAAQNVSESAMARLVSPIGLAEVPGKRPVEVAVSIAGQLIARLNAAPAPAPAAEKAAWQQVQALRTVL